MIYKFVHWLPTQNYLWLGLVEEASDDAPRCARSDTLATMVELTLGLALAVSTLFTLALMSLPTRCESHGSRKREAIGGKSQGQTTLTVQVLVLGDIGRSPRMQYHSRSFANHGVDVELIGYTGKGPTRQVAS